VNDAAIVDEVRALARLDLNGLRAEWRRRYGSSPKLRSADFLARLLAWRIQAEHFGGLDPQTRMVVTRRGVPQSAPVLAPGVRLEREWRGVKHIVEVTEAGFRWEGKVYSSLSRVAHAITGVKWNGPRFFGLRGQGG
jgi:hypothetical protein